MRKSRLIILQTAVIWVATALLLFTEAWALSLFVGKGLVALTFPYPLDYGEGPLLDQAARLADFRNIYPADLSEAPYSVSNYPPLFMLAQVPFVWLFGPALWYGRLISLLSVAAVSLFVGLTLHALTKDRIAAIAGGLIFPAMPYVVRWSSLSRVDSLGLALSWAGLFVVARWPEKRWSVFVSALLLVAAVYTRQTYILAAPLAAVVWLAAQGQRRRAIETAAIAGGAGLALFALLNLSTGGGFFLNTVTANLNEFSWEQVAFYIRGYVKLMPVLLAGAAAFLVLGLRSREASWWLVSTYLLGGLASACLIGKVGAYINYLLELSAALALVAGALVARYAGHSGVRFVILLATAVQVMIMVQTPQSFYADLQANVTSKKDGMKRLQEIVATSEKPVLADTYMGLLPLNGRRIYIQPFEFSQLSREGKWDKRPFVLSIKRRKFEAIMISGPPHLVKERWTASMLNAIHSNYKPTENFAGTKVYRPRNQGRSR